MAPKTNITVMEIYRRRLGITQLDLAIKVGVTQAVISQYERGYLIGIQTGTVAKIADILGVDPKDLLLDIVEYEFRKKGVAV